MAIYLRKGFSLFDKVSGPWGRAVVIAVPTVFLLLVFLLPFLVIFKISGSEMDTDFFKDVFLFLKLFHAMVRMVQTRPTFKP